MPPSQARVTCMATQIDNTEQKKLERFEFDINLKIEEQVCSILKTTQTEAQQILTESEDNTLKEAFEKIQQTVKEAADNHKKTVTGGAGEYYRTLLRHREELISQLFESLTENLISFTETPAYKKYMVDKLKARKIDSKATILLSEKDFAFSAELKKAVPMKYEIDNNIKIGGFSIKNGEKLQNLTLDEAIQEQRDNFSKNYTLT